MMQTDSLSVKAGKNLKRIIKENGYTQEAFADEFGTDRANLRKWLSNGINKISTIEDIAKFFDIDVWDILK
ncbi:MAG: helix-turn-helix domain-containing protein [Bacilli bacterium]|nr:helix-turn-helix domain-containing protein [Bacilli bacterium]